MVKGAAGHVKAVLLPKAILNQISNEEDMRCYSDTMIKHLDDDYNKSCSACSRYRKVVIGCGSISPRARLNLYNIIHQKHAGLITHFFRFIERVPMEWYYDIL